MTYDLYVGVMNLQLGSKFHFHLAWFTPIYHSVLNVKMDFNQYKPLVGSRSLLRDCEIFANLRLKLYTGHLLPASSGVGECGCWYQETRYSHLTNHRDI